MKSQDLKSQEPRSSVWSLISGAFRNLAPQAADAVDTQPPAADAAVRDEAQRQLTRAGIADDVYHVTTMPVLAPELGAAPGRPFVQQQWVVYVRLRTWSGAVRDAIPHLEWNMQQELHRYGIQVRAVYWRFKSDAIRDAQGA